MSDIGSTSGAPRPSGSDGPGRVGRTAPSHDNPSSSEQDPRPEAGRAAPAETASRHGHHDPAVSLSASLAHVKTGAEIAGEVLGRDADERLVVRTSEGIYLVDLGDKLPPALRNAEALTLKIIQSEHTIEARIIGADGRPVPAEPRATLTLVRIAQSADPFVQDARDRAETGYTVYRPIALHGAEVHPDEGETAKIPVFIPVPDTRVAKPDLPPRKAAGAPVSAQTAGAETAARAATPPLTAVSRILPFVPPVESELPPAPAAPANPSKPAAPPPHVVARAPLVAAGREFVTRLSAPTQTEATENKAEPPLKPGQVVHVTVTDTATAESRPSPAQPRPGGHTRTAAPQPIVTTGTVIALPTKPEPLADEGAVVSKAAPADQPPRAVATPYGTIALPAENTFNAGTKVTVTLEALAPVNIRTTEKPDASAPAPPLGPTSTPAPLPPADVTVVPLADYAQSWPALSALVSTATAINPALGQAIAGKLPSPDRPINPVTLLFLNLIGVKAPTRHLTGADGAKALEQQGQHQLLKALEDDVIRLRSAATDRGPAEWRPFFLPIHTDNATQALVMLVRQSFAEEHHTNEDRERDGPDDETPKKVTRFVLDLSLSRLGPVQVDGMIADKRFDLILRTRDALTETIQSDISELFATALAKNGFEGEASFRAGLPFAVDVAAELRKVDRHGGAVMA